MEQNEEFQNPLEGKLTFLIPRSPLAVMETADGLFWVANLATRRAEESPSVKLSEAIFMALEVAYLAEGSLFGDPS